jgi:hypothetical protein
MFDFPSEIQREKLRGTPLKVLRDSADYFFLFGPSDVRNDEFWCCGTVRGMSVQQTRDMSFRRHDATNLA